MDGQADEIDLAAVKTRSLTGVITLISRSAVIQLVSTLGFLLLSFFLGRPEIGIFIAVNDLVSILGYFSDIGLAASLIQKRSSVSLADLRTTFTLQQILVLIPVIAALIFLPNISGYYHLQGPGIWLLLSLLAGFVLASLKTIPSVILERQLKFQTLAAVEIIENLIFYLVAVLIAWKGGGVMAYAWAVILRGLLGTGLLYYLSPWPIGLAFSRSSLQTLLAFGLPYQLNSLLAVIKDRFLNILLWKFIGADGVGIIGWAQTLSQKPLRFIMDNVTKVTFPAYSRLQDHPQELQAALEKSLLFITLITFPVVAGLAAVAPWVVRLIPKYAKWEVALLPLALYCLNSAWASVSTPLTNTLNSLGKVKINTRLMLMWTALTWLLTPYFASRWGFIGVSLATGLISFSSLVPVIIVRRLIPFSLWLSVGRPAIASLSMLALVLLLTWWLPVTWGSFFLVVGIGAFVYMGLIYRLAGPALTADAGRLWHAFRPS